MRITDTTDVDATGREGGGDDDDAYMGDDSDDEEDGGDVGRDDDIPDVERENRTRGQFLLLTKMSVMTMAI